MPKIPIFEDAKNMYRLISICANSWISRKIQSSRTYQAALSTYKKTIDERGKRITHLESQLEEEKRASSSMSESFNLVKSQYADLLLANRRQQQEYEEETSHSLQQISSLAKLTDGLTSKLSSINAKNQELEQQHRHAVQQRDLASEKATALEVRVQKAESLLGQSKLKEGLVDQLKLRLNDYDIHLKNSLAYLLKQPLFADADILLVGNEGKVYAQTPSSSRNQGILTEDKLKELNLDCSKQGVYRLNFNETTYVVDVLPLVKKENSPYALILFNKVPQEEIEAETTAKIGGIRKALADLAKKIRRKQREVNQDPSQIKKSLITSQTQA